MKRILILSLLILSMSIPVQAVDDAYLMIGASNVARGVAAASLESTTGVKVIMCAQGGTGVNLWTNPIRFRNCMAKTNGYHIKAIVFVNGEWEASRGWSDWGDQTTKLVGMIEAQHGDLPVYFVRAHISFPGKYLAAVRADQEAFDGCMVNTDDLTLDSAWHYDTPSAVIIGQRLAACEETP